MDLAAAVEKELKGCILKIHNNMKVFGNKTPNVANGLVYSEKMSDDGDWTGSFWTGMVMMAYLLNEDEKYLDYLHGFQDMYATRMKEGYKDHDLGFLYQLYAVNMYRLTNHDVYRKMSVTAAENLMCRYNNRGEFIRAWGRLISDFRRGKLIIDCLFNLPLLFCASRMGGQSNFADAAKNHARTTMEHNIRNDGSTYHTYNFDYVSGLPTGGENEGGYSDESCWSRGQSWAIYGFYLAWQHTGETAFLDASKKVADYFIANLNDDFIPAWDFKLDESAPKGVDTSAAAIAASGLYDLSKALKDEHYRKIADNILLSLIKNYSHVFDDKSEALIDKCYCGAFEDGKRIVNQCGAIFGDYYYMEALMKSSGYDLQMWDL